MGLVWSHKSDGFLLHPTGREVAEAKQEAGFRVTFSVLVRVRVRGLSKVGGRASVKIPIRTGAGAGAGVRVRVRSSVRVRLRIRVRNEDSVWGAVPEEPMAPEVA